MYSVTEYVGIVIRIAHHVHQKGVERCRQQRGCDACRGPGVNSLSQPFGHYSLHSITPVSVEYSAAECQHGACPAARYSSF